MDNNFVYFDNSSTTKILPEVLNEMASDFSEFYGNPSSLHLLGIQSERLIKSSREVVSKNLNCQPKNIYFCSSATEANNLAILGYLNANKHSGKNIITSKIEHPSVLEVYKSLSNKGYNVLYVDVDKDGVIDLAQLKSLLDDNTALVSIMYVNNEIGTIQPIADIAKIIKINSSAALHVDAVQAFCKIKIDVKNLDVDLLTISSHKIHGPKGIGALYIKDRVRLTPIIVGGGQEGGLRSGTECAPLIHAFSNAIKLLHDNLDANFNHYMSLRKTFIKQLETTNVKYKINSPINGLPNILNISFNGVRSEIMLHHLEQYNIFVSSGSACSSKKNSSSETLKAIGLSNLDSDCAIRFSFCYENTVEQCIYAVEKICEIYNKIIK